MDDWTPLVDLARLSAWMDARGLESGPLDNPALLAGGTQNILLHFTRGGRGFVLRRPPLHPRADGNTTMRREARVLAALAGSEVPHPRLIAVCDDPSVLGACFYLMEPVDGFNATNGLPALHLASAGARHRMGLSMVEALRALRAVDHAKAGLSDLGKPQGYLERQVPRWLAQLDSYRDFEGWPGPGAIAHLDEVARWLAANRPATFTPGIMHGDFHLANVMFRNDGPELAAIVDWELVTIGDPMLDLGWLIATWPGADGRGAGTIEVYPWDGFATTRELLAHHAALCGGLPEGLDWYVVMAWFKLGILMEGTFARAFAGNAPMATGERLHASTVNLFRQAHEAINAR